MEEQEEEKVQEEQEKKFENEKYTRGGGGKEQGTRIKGDRKEHREQNIREEKEDMPGETKVNTRRRRRRRHGTRRIG